MTFLDLYTKYTEKQESPLMFHLWTGITIISAALGRKVYFDKGYYRLYPNLFVILVAGSARCRKSTAINIGVDILRRVPNQRIISGKVTPEKFLAELMPPNKDDDAAALVHASELSVFLTKQNYGEPLIHLLTDLYDCKETFDYKTKNSGEVNLKRTFLSIIAATTPEGIAKGIPPSAMEEGFASRVLFPFQADTDRRNALPELTTEEKATEIELSAWLTRISKMQGQITFAPTARAWYVEWYRNMQPPPDKRLEGMFGRKHDHMLRLGMIFAVADGRLVIDMDDMGAAERALDFLEKSSVGAFSEMGGDDKTPFLTRAKTMIARVKRIPHSTLLRELYPIRADVFRAIMDTLLESGVVERDPENKSVYVWSDWFQSLKKPVSGEDHNQDSAPDSLSPPLDSPDRTRT